MNFTQMTFILMECTPIYFQMTFGQITFVQKTFAQMTCSIDNWSNDNWSNDKYSRDFCDVFSNQMTFVLIAIVEWLLFK